MKSTLVQLDDETYRALSRLVPPVSQRQVQFIQEAIRRAVPEA